MGKSGKSAGLKGQGRDIQHRLDVALKHHRSGRLQKAKALYRKILKVDPRNADALHMLGLLLHQQNDHEAAIRLFSRAIEYGPESTEVYTNLGSALQSCNRIDEAIAAFRQAIKINPDYALAHNNLGNALREAGEKDEAIASFRNAIGLNPNYALAHYNLGNALYAEGELDKAIASFRNALAVDPDNKSVVHNLAMALMETGKTNEAIIQFKHILQLDSSNLQAKTLLAALQGEAAADAHAHRENVERYFDDFAETFDQHLVEKLEYKTPEIINLSVRSLIGPEHEELDVLDIGCGTGLCGPLFRDLARTLTGSDLSELMLEKAKQRGVYDKLVSGDMLDFLNPISDAYDLIIAVDVFVYIVDLAQIFMAAAQALRSGGLFAFSLEAEEEGVAYVLRPSGRYAHSMSYIRRLMDDAGLQELSVEKCVLRKDMNQPVNGYICVFGKSTASG
jgi:predicted TPR repeat methyltransferase